MAPRFRLFGRTRQLEEQLDSFFDKLSESSVMFRLAVKVYIKEGANEEFAERLEKVNELESQADDLRRTIEKQLYADMLIPDSRGDVLGLIETVDQVNSLFEGILWTLSIEKPEIPDDFRADFRKLSNMVVKAVDELGLGARVFFRSPHDVPAYNHKVMLYEKEADRISTRLKTAIFDSDLDLARKLHLREIAEQIDNIADQAEDVADRLAIYAIKRMA
ncbi:MAG TPA: DUF47 family protein [Rhizobiales bacterium]|nr:DUF47 family protein [Hyphomicrobiales bacterium]